MRSKTLGIGITLLAAAAIWAVAGSSPQAFHSGGVAECGGCHSMHAPKAAGSFLLIGTDASSTCLTCHMHAGDTGPSSYHIATADADMPVGTAPKQRTPGGDFGWLQKTYSFTVRGSTTTEEGQSHGHNIVAMDTSFVADTKTMAPGGTFPSSQLGCTSCHDPHGSVRRLSDGSYVRGGTLRQAVPPIVGNGSYDTSATPGTNEAVGAYRLLRGLNDTSVSGVTFAGVAIAIAPSSYNRTEASTQTRVAYGASGTNTWGNWCGSCHTDMHSSGSYVHPVDQSLTSNIANIYNAYKMSGDLTGTAASAFSSLVPFAENTDSIATLQAHAKNNDSYLNGPASADKVTCLSCHRAHASGFPEALRWNMEGEFMVYNSLYPGTDTTPTAPQFARGRTGAETQAAYYDRPVTQFASYQRVLCNKCHARD